MVSTLIENVSPLAYVVYTKQHIHADRRIKRIKSGVNWLHGFNSRVNIVATHVIHRYLHSVKVSNLWWNKKKSR